MKIFHKKAVIISGVLLMQIAMACACSSANSPLRDSWEEVHPPRNFDYKPCLSVASDAIVPVIGEKAEKAIALLERSASVSLDNDDLSEFTGVRNSSVPMLIKSRVEQLENQRAIVLRERKGSWGGGDEMRLVELERLQSSLGRLKAFLVRAVAKNEATGSFSALSCSDALFVSHISLGETVPKSVRVPILVFLERAPANVYLTTAMAR